MPTTLGNLRWAKDVFCYLGHYWPEIRALKKTHSSKLPHVLPLNRNKKNGRSAYEVVHPPPMFHLWEHEQTRELNKELLACLPALKLSESCNKVFSYKYSHLSNIPLCMGHLFFIHSSVTGSTGWCQSLYSVMNSMRHSLHCPNSSVASCAIPHMYLQHLSKRLPLSDIHSLYANRCYVWAVPLACNTCSYLSSMPT